MITITARPNRGMVIESKLMISQDELNMIQQNEKVVKQIAKDSNTVISTTLVDNQPFLTISQNSYHSIDVDELKEIEKQHEEIHRDLIGSIEASIKNVQEEQKEDDELSFVKDLLEKFDDAEQPVLGAEIVVSTPELPCPLLGGHICKRTFKKMLKSYVIVYGKEESDQTTDEKERVCGQER
jgi:hypothetical protein